MPEAEEIEAAWRKPYKLNMEGALVARDRVGIQDFVLLDSHTSENAFLDNLRKRYQENLIYTYIGTLLVSVNPYKELGIYTVKQMEQYKGVNFFELPPHIYAIADNAYRVMCTEYNNHFILISGESGAGKTEASKKILQYFAMTCPTTEQLQVVRDRLLLSNPVLEVSRKCTLLPHQRLPEQQDFSLGAPVGGHILSYLIEKSRVVYQNPGERNFHIFYQLLEGGEEDLLHDLGLERNPQKYMYLIQVVGEEPGLSWPPAQSISHATPLSPQQGHCAKVSSINDRSDWRTVHKAFTVIDFKARDLENLFGVIASVLHLGNIQFEEDSNGHAIITTGSQIKWISKVLSPLDVDLAFYARDAVAKAIYGRTFTWLVNKINSSLANKDLTRKTVIGLLDIYGFEVFETNSFEQFCINYCNEKLQQLLIEMTLKAEQEEYELEGIEWEPIPYFNNKIICDLVEEKHKGIISILDEECLRPGEATDLSFLEKLEEKVGDHAHFVTRKLADQKTRKSIDWVDFRLLHYAGEVTYCTVGEKTRAQPLLVLCRSKNGILRECFHLSELDNRRRPETVATQFKNSLASLIDILMSKEPSYIRCIKPNDDKAADKFDDSLIRHQVKYLGLMEHLRVRRAGFAYRRKYEHFLQRYKSLCPDTWPYWQGTAAKGVEKLIKHIGYKPEEYKMGKTKIFIRFPRTLFATEDAFEFRKNRLVSRIQAKYKGCLGKREFQKMREAAIKLESCWRGVLARKLAKKRMWAAQTIRKYIRGFIHRKQPLNRNNKDFVRLVQYTYLMKLRDHIPKNVLDKSWLKPPEIMQETSEFLRKICTRNLVRKYCRGITAQKKAQVKSELLSFCGWSLNGVWLKLRLSGEAASASKTRLVVGFQYVTPVVKYDRNGFKPRERLLVLTRVAAYVVEMAKIKQRIEYATLRGLSASSLGDHILVIHVSEDSKPEKVAVSLYPSMVCVCVCEMHGNKTS
uniref:Myosin IH n=1 Tax=Podarcis muralis TaxID=64176 RepID=A0A670J7F7_PODMU